MACYEIMNIEIFTIVTIFTGVLLSTSVFLYVILRRSKNKIKELGEKLQQLVQVQTAQEELETLLNTGISAFLHISLKKSLTQLEDLQKQMGESEKLNTELTQWVTDFGILTANVYKQLKSIDERGMFEKDDDVGFLFQDMVNIITEYNNRINNIQNDPTNTTDDTQQ